MSPGPSADPARWHLSPRWAKGVSLVQGAGEAATPGWALRGGAGRGPHSINERPRKRHPEGTQEKERPRDRRGRDRAMQPQPRGARSCRRQEVPSPGRARPCDTPVRTRPRSPGCPVPLHLRELKLMFLESVMPSNHLILSCPLLLLPSSFPSIRVFSNKSAFHQVAKVLEFQLQHQSFE